MENPCPFCSQPIQGYANKKFCSPKCRREWRKANSLCTECGRESRPDKTLCKRCAQRNQKRVDRWQAKVGYGKIRYARDKEKGICLQCKKPHKSPPNLCPLCQQQYNEYHKQYYQDNKEEYNEKVAEWQRQNPEKVHGYKLNYHRTHKLEDLEYGRRWRKENPEKAKVRNLRSRLRRRDAKGTCSAKQLRQRIAYYGELCYLCGKPYEEIDHVIPIITKALGWPANLRPACRSCNASKGGKQLRDFLREREDTRTFPSPPRLLEALSERGL